MFSISFCQFILYINKYKIPKGNSNNLDNFVVLLLYIGKKTFYNIKQYYFKEVRFMAGSTFGNIFRITTWGESHGRSIGVVVDGCPAGILLEKSYIQEFLNRRKPGESKYSTQRKESDLVEIHSGIFEGRTTGTPIAMTIYNQTQRSSDYSDIKSYYRPGHADYTYDSKYGFRDYRGGGRSSGRETIGRVAGGAIAMRLLETIGIEFYTYTKSIGPIHMETFDFEESKRNAFRLPDLKAAKKAESYLEDCMKDLNSSGGMIECIIKKVPVGLGDPVFEKLDANLAKAILSVGAMKGIEFGKGMEVASSTGKENNDSFYTDNQVVKKKSNHAGGILGGISDGSDIVFRVAVKPTPSIFAKQDTINQEMENIQINIKGRHDPVIVPRAVVVVESMAALVLADALLLNMTSNIEHVKKIYQ